MSRRILSAALVLLVEGYLYVRYAQLDAEFHFWLHGLLGGALGMAAVTAVRLVTSRRRPHRRPAVAPWEAGGTGHLYSAVPDVLFLGFGVLHMLWMDVFAFHITVHFIPAPLITLLVVFLLSLAAYGLAMSGRVRLAAAALAASAVACTAALSVAAPIPADIEDLRAHPRIALCPSIPVGETAAGHRAHRDPPVGGWAPRR